MKRSSFIFWFTYSLGLCVGHAVASWWSHAIAIPGLFAVLWAKDRLEKK